MAGVILSGSIVAHRLRGGKTASGGGASGECIPAFVRVGRGQKRSIGEGEESLLNWASGIGLENGFQEKGGRSWKAGRPSGW